MTNSLRIKLAEALGWKLCRDDGKTWRTPEQKKRNIELLGTEDGPWCFESSPPDFTRFDSGAALLVEHLHGMGWSCELSNLYAPQWECWFQKNNEPHHDRPVHYAKADTLPLAIVAAAQKVLNITVDTSAKG